jgi:hypothetical protein
MARRKHLILSATLSGAKGSSRRTQHPRSRSKVDRFTRSELAPGGRMSKDARSSCSDTFARARSIHHTLSGAAARGAGYGSSRAPRACRRRRPPRHRRLSQIAAGATRQGRLKNRTGPPLASPLGIFLWLVSDRPSRRRRECRSGHWGRGAHRRAAIFWSSGVGVTSVSTLLPVAALMSVVAALARRNRSLTALLAALVTTQT